MTRIRFNRFIMGTALLLTGCNAEFVTGAGWAIVGVVVLVGIVTLVSWVVTPGAPPAHQVVRRNTGRTAPPAGDDYDGAHGYHTGYTVPEILPFDTGSDSSSSCESADSSSDSDGSSCDGGDGSSD